MKSLLFILVFLIGNLTVFTQTRNPTPTPFQVIEDESVRRNVEKSTDLDRRSNDLRMTENLPVKNDEDRKIARERIQPLYRETTKEEMQFLAPSVEDSEKYAQFLKEKNTGLIKLIADKGCADNPDIVKNTPQCENLTMPGAGSAYSFRIKDYRILDLSDLNFRKNRFESLGVLNHGILVNLGDVPLEELTLDSKGVKYLAKFKAADDFNKAAEIAQKLTQGFEDNGFRYASIALVDENRPYALRVIAYRGVSAKTVGGIAYNENDFDKREDIIIAFRVVRLNPEEDVTILWKELDSNKSPKLSPDK